MNKRTKQTSKNHIALPSVSKALGSIPSTGWLHTANKHVRRCSTLTLLIKQWDTSTVYSRLKPKTLKHYRMQGRMWGNSLTHPLRETVLTMSQKTEYYHTSQQTCFSKIMPKPIPGTRIFATVLFLADKSRAQPKLGSNKGWTGS